jgi:transposase
VKRRISSQPGRPPRYVCVQLIRDLHTQGHSLREIALATGIGYGTIRRAYHGQAPAGADVSPAPRRRPASSRRQTSKAGTRRMAATG